MVNLNRRNCLKVLTAATATALNSPTDLAVLCAQANASPTGSPLPFLMPSDFEDLNLVAWRVEQGQPDPHNPLLEPETPWDSGALFGFGTVVRDPLDGLWKAWMISNPPSIVPIPPGSSHFGWDARLTYFESKDGVSWQR